MKNTKLATKNTVNTTEVSTVTLDKNLLSLMNKAAKIYVSIKRSELETLLPKYKAMGEAFVALREAYPSNKAFKEACDASPLAEVSRQDRGYWMELATNWEQIEQLRSEGIITGRSPQTIVRQLKDYLKGLEQPIADADADASEGEGEGESVDTSTEALAKIVSDLLARANKNGYNAEAVIAEIIAQSK